MITKVQGLQLTCESKRNWGSKTEFRLQKHVKLRNLRLCLHLGDHKSARFTASLRLANLSGVGRSKAQFRLQKHVDSRNLRFCLHLGDHKSARFATNLRI